MQETENTVVKWTDPKTGRVRNKGNMPLRELKKLVSDEVYEEERVRRKQRAKQYRQENKDKIAEYYQENKDKLLEYQKQYRQENRDRLLEYQKQYRQENRDRLLEYQKQYRQENKDKIAEYKKQYRQENKDKIAEYCQENKDKLLEQSKQYYQENRDRLLEYNKQYYQENPEVGRQARHRRKANLNNCLPTDNTFLKQFNQSKQQCPITGSNTVELEHVYPVSKGWLGNNRGNLMWLQSNLNRSKGNKNVFTWLTELTQSDIDFLLREEDAVPTIEQFRQKYYEVLEEQATLLGMTFEEYRTEYNNRFQESEELTEATV